MTSDVTQNPNGNETWARDSAGWLERLYERVSEWSSSILVKEARQAIKSRHFLWTYFALLFAVGLVAILGIAIGGADIEGSNAGRGLLFAFFIILGFPLGIVIPFSAYRSLSREYEDGTIHLVSITTMKPYQIVIGKFGSAVMQMLVYLSVLAPCILFTYLLRGISLEQILLGLGICVGMSLCLTILGLFLAGAIRSRMWSVGVSVLFVLLLGWLYWMWCILAWEMLDSSMPTFQVPEFRLGVFWVVGMFGSTALLLLVTASAQISFPADNRSSKVRWMMVVQQSLFLAAIAATALNVYDDFGGGTFFDYEPFVIFAMIAAHYWLVMGFLMMGESPHMSRRVQRSLPNSILTRSTLSLLMPGPGRGYLFALTMIWGFGLTMLLMMVWFLWIGWNVNARVSPFPQVSLDADFLRMLSAVGVACGYPTIYLSIGFLLNKILLHPRCKEWPTGSGPMVSLLLGVLIVILPMITVLIWHFSTRDYYLQSDYSASQVFNWYWTIGELFRSSPSEHLYWLLLLIGPVAVSTLWAMLQASKELLYRPVPIPERVKIDQQKPVVQLPAGESIDEIFGELEPPSQ